MFVACKTYSPTTKNEITVEKSSTLVEINSGFRIAINRDLGRQISVSKTLWTLRCIKKTKCLTELGFWLTAAVLVALSFNFGDRDLNLTGLT